MKDKYSKNYYDRQSINVIGQYPKIITSLYIYWLIHIIRKIPVVVYQMGKVGSLSITNSLAKAGIHPLFHVHRMNPHNIQNIRAQYISRGQNPQNESLGLCLYREIQQSNKKAKIISSFREPIARNISAYFQNLEVLSNTSHLGNYKDIQILISKYLAEYPHHVPLNWFDIELKNVLNIDVYDYPFPKDRGYTIIRKKNIDLLLLKIEIPDTIKEMAISEFLALDYFRLSKKNIGQEKKYASIYQDFKRSIKLPAGYIDLMMESKYTRHFYSDAEISEYKNKWSSFAPI